MIVRSLEIRRFRNVGALAWQPAPGLNLVAGENGTGKTSLLEGLHFALLGRSFRTSRDEDCLPWGAETPRAPTDDEPPAATLAAAELENRHGVRRSKIVLGRGWKRVWRDGLMLDRLADLWADVAVVTFSPEDVDLFRDAPSRRRKFMDQTLSQLSRPYLESLGQYTRALKQVNALLKPRADGSRARRAEAEAFYPSLAEAGAVMMRLREGELAALREGCAELFAELGGAGELKLVYAPSMRPRAGEKGAEEGVEGAVEKGSAVERGKGGVEPSALLELFNRSHAESERMQSVVVGPHRDDLRVKLAGHDLARYGSQGQHRLAALTLKLAAARRLGEGTADSPILLLDDFGSELDAARRASVLSSLRGRMQVIVTATHPEDLGGAGMFDEVRFVVAGEWAVADQQPDSSAVR